MVNENQNTKKENVRPSRRECLDCENYKRKIKEADQTLSNRDVLIQMLQKEIQKMEDRHKKFIDDYEKLRYVHCTTLQELTNLKEIQKKLEEDKFPLRARAACTEKNLGNEVEIYQNENTSQDGLPHNNCCVKKSSYSTFKDVAQVGSILQGQNEALKQLLVKFLEEVKQVTRYGTAFKEDENTAEKQNNEYIAIIEDMNRQIKDLNALVMKLKNEITVITNDKQQQAEKSSNYVDKLKAENGCIKEQLSEKKSILSSCLCVLEQNHCNISNLSTTIESIICEKKVLAQETMNLKEVIEENQAQCIKKNQEICELKEKLNSINQERRKEKEILKEDLCKCREFVTVLQQQLVEKEKSVHCERCSLFDQLKLTEESNKVLSDTLVIVTDENKSNLNKIAILSNELKDVNKELEQSESTLKKYVSQLEGEVEDYKCKLKVSQAQTDCEKCGETSEGEDPKELEEKIMLLKTELNEVSLENSEYEEENKYYCQKIDSLMHDLHSLEEENFKIQADNKLYCEKVSKLKKDNDSINENKENEIKQLIEQINKLNLENNSLKRKINDVELKTSLEEITRLNIENSLLQEQIKTLQEQYESEIKALKEELTQLKDELNLRNCNEVEEELMKVQEERRKLTAENELLCDQIQKLQKEHENINDKDNEIATLKDEIRKREKDTIENQELKETINNLKQKYSLESDESTLGKCKAEIKKLESENNQLHADIQKLQHSCRTCTSKNEEMQQQNALLRKELGKACEEKRKMEHACHTLCDEKEKLKRHSDAIESEIESIMQDLRKTKEANEKLEKENEVLGLQVGSLQAQPCRLENPNEELINIREENSKLDAENKILNDYKIGMNKISHKNTMIQGVERACEEKKWLVSECCSLNQGKRDGSQLSIANDSKNTILQEIKMTNDEKKNVEEENEHLKRQIESLRDNVTQDADTSLEIRETNSKLKIENRLLENQVQKLQQYCYNYGAKIAEIEYKNIATQDELKRVYEARKKVIDKHDELSQELEAVKDEKANIENETKETRKKVVIITEELNEALKEIEGLKKQINSQTNNDQKKMKDAKTDTNSCCDREHSSSDELNAGMELNTNSIGEKQTNVQQDMIQKIENENAGLKNELAKLQQYLRECKEREATQANVEELKELIKSLKQKIKIYENENNDLRNQLQNLNQHFSKYDTETEQVKNKIEMINEQLQMARAEKANIEDDYQRLKVQMEKLQQYCTQCSDGNEDIRKEVTILSEELKTAMQEKSVLEKENEVLLRELEDLKQYCIYCSGQKKESETDIMNTELRSNEITIDNMEKETLKKQIEILEQSLSNCKNENTKLKETTERLNQELQTTRQEQLKNANEDKNVCCQLEKPQDTEKYERQAEEINNKMTEILNTTKQENARLEKENENLRRELQKIQHSIFDNQKIDEESENKINATTKEVKDVQLGTACVDKEAEAQQKDLRRHGCDTNADNEEMKHKLKIALEEKDRIERENENLKSAIQNFQQETSKCNDCNEKLKNEISELTEKLKEDHEGLQKTHNENELLKEQINGLQREALEAYENEESAILLLQKKITELEQRQSEKLEQLSSCLPQQAGKPEKCCHEVEDLNSINQGLQKDIEAMEIELCQRGCMLNHLEECLDKSNKTLEVCDTEMKEMHNTVKNLNAENKELKQQLQKYVYEAEVNKAEVVNLQEKLNQNRRHSKQAEIERNQLCKNLEESANAKGELASLRQQYNDLLKAKEENDQELRGLREQYDMLRQTLEATNNECDKIKRAYKELKASFKSQISNYKEEIQIISNDNDTFSCEPEKISLANRNLQELELKILEKETAIQLLQHENEDLSFEISQLRKNVQKLSSDKQRLTSALNNLLYSLGDKLKNSGDSMTLLNEKNDIPNQCTCKNSDGNADTTTPSPKGRCNCMSVIMSTYKMDQVPQNFTGCDNSTCIKDVMKFEGKAFRSSSEVLTVPFEFGDEVQRDEKEEKETAGCCGQKDAKHNPVDSKNTPDLSNTEPFIIEPDI